MIGKLRLDRTTWMCSLACTATFLVWVRHATGGIHGGILVFFLLMPLAFFYLGDGTLRWLRVPLRSTQTFPVAFLFGSTLGILLLFFLRMALSIPLVALDGLLFLFAVCAALFAPAREIRNDETPREWVVITSVVLMLAAATCWTQDLRPALSRQGDKMELGAWIDVMAHAEMIAAIRHDISFLKLGHPDMVGWPLPIYHYASYTLPASVEAWSSPGAIAFDTVTTFWDPFGFVLVGFAAFVLGAEWGSDLAGVVAAATVLLVPSPPVYGIPVVWYSFHWVLAMSAGLAYGIAAATCGLFLLTRGLREDRNSLLVAGATLLAANVLIKMHIALVSIPLGILWILWCKKGWSARKRFFIGTAVALIGFFVLLLQTRPNFGPRILPNGRPASVSYVFQILQSIQPGIWHRLIFYHLFSRGLVHLFWVAFVLLATVLGLWLLLGAVLLFTKLRRREWKVFDVVPLFAGVIFFYYAFVTSASEFGAPDELWHRPFVWLYFIVAVWCAVNLADWLQRRFKTHAPALAVSVVALSAVFVGVPWTEGKTLQRSLLLYPHELYFHFDAGFMDCAQFVRDHSAQTDVIQDDLKFEYPILSAFSERRAYLGRSLVFWKIYLNGTAEMQEAERRSAVLEKLKAEKDAGGLQAVRDETGIRWYIASPDEALSWPSDLLQHPAFTSEGYRLYDLKQLASAH